MGVVLAALAAALGLIAFLVAAADENDPPPQTRWDPEDWWTDA